MNLAGGKTEPPEVKHGGQVFNLLMSLETHVQKGRQIPIPRGKQDDKRRAFRTAVNPTHELQINQWQQGQNTANGQGGGKRKIPFAEVFANEDFQQQAGPGTKGQKKSQYAFFQLIGALEDGAIIQVLFHKQ